MIDQETLPQTISEDAVLPKKRSFAKREVLTANWTMFIVAILFLTVGAMAQSFEFHSGIIITHYVILSIPVFIWSWYNRIDIVSKFKFKKPKVKDLLRLIGSGLLFLPFVGFLNATVALWLVTYLEFQQPEIPTNMSWYGPLLTFFIAAITPGLCEEFFFRGMILSAYQKRFGLFTSAIMSSVLFGFFHFNPMNLFGPIFLGLMFSWVLHVTGSIWTAMFSHMINNGVAVLLLYSTSKMVQTAETSPAPQEMLKMYGAYTPLYLIVVLAVLGGFGFACLKMGLYVLKGLRKNHPKTGEHIGIGSKEFYVTGLSDDAVYLIDINEDLDWQSLNNEAFNEKIISTQASKIFSNKNSRYLSPVWHRTFQLRLSFLEALPLVLFGTLYIGYMVLLVLTFMKEGV